MKRQSDAIHPLCERHIMMGMVGIGERGEFGTSSGVCMDTLGGETCEIAIHMEMSVYLCAGSPIGGEPYRRANLRSGQSVRLV